MNAPRPLLSAVVVTKNRAAYLERFLQGLLAEVDGDYPDTEIIVIDGGSSDGTVDILRRHAHRLAYWVSEPDSGVSEAVNKGLARAKGDFIRLMGDDDDLMPGCLHKGVDYLVAHPEVDWAIFHANWQYESADGKRSPFGVHQPSGPFSLRDLLRFPYSGAITPESAYCRRRAFEIGGAYDTGFHLFAYWEMWIRHAKHGLRFEIVPEQILHRLQTPVSDGQVFRNHPRWNEEYFAIVRKHGNRYWELWHRFGGTIVPIRYFATRFCNRFGIRPRTFLRSVAAKLRPGNAP
jgi:glycosyltransferase involved in cell wall biosynthesis